MNENQTMTFEEVLDKHGSLVFTNVGVSMMPLLRQGRDLMVIVKKGAERCKKYDAVLFKRDNGQYVLHRVLEVRENDYLIVGDNCWQKEYVREDQILGIMTEVVRDGKKISVDDKNYQRYVHLWCDHFPARAAVLRTKAYGRAAAGKLYRTIRPKR